MKVIIAGSRECTDYDLVVLATKSFNGEITEVVSGTAKGADRLGERWANCNSIPIVRFPAEWNKYGKGAGFIRNKQMVEYADALIAIWNCKSKGTKHMIDTARRLGLSIYIWYFGLPDIPGDARGILEYHKGTKQIRRK